nr:alpha/beta hydrolase [Rhodococcus sp. (in: high G+C Gram-positive bacteria)]
MALDEHVAHLIEGMQRQGLKSFEEMTVDEGRGVVATFTGLQVPAPQIASVAEAEYTSDGTDLPLRIYTPEGPGPHPVVLYIHGGGFFAGNLDVVDEPARATAHDTTAIVVTAGYRLAPEHKFPAATNDVWAALNWVADHIADYNGNPGQITIMGDSAGGNLATVTALRARDENGPKIVAQVLIYPVIDPSTNFPSRDEFGEGHIITAAGLDWFWEQYLSSPTDTDNPYAVPTRSGSLGGLPRTLILTTENEVARDEAENYGEQLRAADVDTTVTRFDGLVHGVFWMSGAVPRSKEMRTAVKEFLADVNASAIAH